MNWLSGELPEYLTPAEVCKLYNVDNHTLMRWARSGKLTATRTLGGHRRYPSGQFADVIAYLREGAGPRHG